MSRSRHRPEGTVTRGTTAPNRLRRVDRWIAATQAQLLRSAEQPPLVVDLGFGASPVTTVELYERLRMVRPDVEVIGLEIDPARVEEGGRFLGESRRSERHPGLAFGLGGFELPVPKPPLLVRALNVLRQYDEDEAWRAWDRPFREARCVSGRSERDDGAVPHTDGRCGDPPCGIYAFKEPAQRSNSAFTA